MSAAEFHELLAQSVIERRALEQNRRDHIRNQLGRVFFHDLNGWVKRSGNLAKLTASSWNLKNDDLVAIATLSDKTVRSADIYIVVGCEGLLVKIWLLALYKTIELPE